MYANIFFFFEKQDEHKSEFNQDIFSEYKLKPMYIHMTQSLAAKLFASAMRIYIFLTGRT